MMDMPYKFDRYKNGNKMKQGCLTYAASTEEAVEDAARLYAAEGGKQVLVLTDTPDLTAELEELRTYRDLEATRQAKADCYDRICERLGVESDVLGAIAARDARIKVLEAPATKNNYDSDFAEF